MGVEGLRMWTGGFKRELVKPLEGGIYGWMELKSEGVTSRISATLETQFPIKLGPLPLVSGEEGLTMAAEPRESDPTWPKKPSISSLDEKMFRFASFLGDESVSPKFSLRSLGKHGEKRGLAFNPLFA